MKINREKLSTVAAVAVYPARIIQLGSVVISGFCVCYLVWMHHHHLCAIYSCSDREQIHASVPIGEVLFITASVLATLEWLLFGASLAFQARTGKSALIDTWKQFVSACLVLFVYSIGFVAFASISTVRATWPYCYRIWSISSYEAPETYFGIITQSAVTSGLISWIATLFITLFSLVELQQGGVFGKIRLDNDTPLPITAEAVSIQDVAVDSSS